MALQVDISLSIFQPLPNLTCDTYMEKYFAVAPGYLLNLTAIESCQYCPLSRADQYTAQSSIHYSTRRRNYGIEFSYLLFNVVMAIVLYYTFRV